MSQNKPLTAKQEAFARNYVANGFNATQAAISAGYSKDSAGSIGEENLKKPEIALRLAELQKGTTERAKASADDVFEMLTDAANFDYTQFMEVHEIEKIGKNGPYTKVVLTLNCKLSELPTRVRRLVTGIKEGMFGVEVTWFSKEKALDMLARFHGMNNDKLKVETEYTGKSAAELAEIVKAKLAALRLDE
jgi:phage terminase small subunit